MRNLALVWGLAGVALLSASLYVHSETIDSADADYCIDGTRETTEFDGKRASAVWLVLVKKNNDLKNIHDSIKCTGSYCKSFFSNFDFVDGLARHIFSFNSVAVGCRDGVGTIFDGPCMKNVCSEDEYRRTHRAPSPKIEFDFPLITSYATTTLEKFNKDDLLRFKNKIIDVNIEQRVICMPDLDTTVYRIDFRARITGECGCDSIKERRK